MTCVAITLWEGRVSPVFDVCREAAVLQVEDGQVTATRRVTLEAMPPSYRVGWLASLGVETLICGAISEPLRQELEGQGIRVLAFVSGEQDEVVRAYLAGTLAQGAFAMPGCARHRGRGARGRHQQGGRCGRPSHGGR
jgi:predicted Fe-Mo cluster-binding NifX family protein